VLRTGVDEIEVPEGFLAAAGCAGLKGEGRLDAAVFLSAGSAQACALFTRNEVVSHSVAVSRTNLARSGGRARAILANSGNANACLGPSGTAATAAMVEKAARSLGAPAEEVLVASTGLIGVPLAYEALAEAYCRLLGAASPAKEAFMAAAEAITTTDTFPKVATYKDEEEGFTILCLAKGAAMLQPSLATMLAFFFTDAALEREALRWLFASACQDTFGMLCFDWATSTNDTVVLVCSPLARPASEERFGAGLKEAASAVVEQMTADAEGSTRALEVRVTGAASSEQARAVARHVASSLLVRCSIHGADPYWGRIVSEVGAARAGIAPERLTVSYGPYVVYRGEPVAFDAGEVRRYLNGRRVTIEADLGLGQESATAYSADISPEYVRLNSVTY
jgi:glutamate N-acetyltransferase/amino-acid N-acetyltransferase